MRRATTLTIYKEELDNIPIVEKNISRCVMKGTINLKIVVSLCSSLKQIFDSATENERQRLDGLHGRLVDVFRPCLVLLKGS